MVLRHLRSPFATTAGIIFCLFGSGLSSLVYQTTWFREFRYIFGASTASTAAVLAVFMGGLGLGSIILGKRADTSGNPLKLYAILELLIAVLAAVSPLLVMGVRSFYLWLGGSSTMDPGTSLAIRLLLGGLVLFPPAFLMGGTLPAAITAMITGGDTNRRHVALCYGANAMGAVAGVGLATFYMLEHFGNRGTLWIGCVVNLLIACTALGLAKVSRTVAAKESSEEPASLEPLPAALAPSISRLVYLAAAVTGFSFFLMELVWYRMLAPILGGSTFTFGLILAVALAGIAMGSLLAASFLRRVQVGFGLFAFLCIAQAVCLALPFALGDRIALWAILSQSLGQISFGTRIVQWTVTTMAVIFPASLLAGAQFPILIALLGHGKAALGTQTGRAYAWNTLGAVVGSLAGGFGLLPILTAPGTWRFVVMATVALGLLFLWVTVRQGGWRLRWSMPAVLAGVALMLLTARGPSAVWRHNPIGAGRAKLEAISQNNYERFARRCRQSVVWEVDGQESSVALIGDEGYAFFVNGKCDGNSVGDAGTQVMLGILGALVHTNPQSACVIGLGTGSTAGWLAQIPSVQSVEVVELEHAIRHVAEACAPVNHHVLENPKVHLTYNDAREVLLTTKARYDLIVSEPSNPYRAGVASLFTTEYYRAVERCLQPGGIFLQWLQAYEIDATSISTICATLGTIFPGVEIWETEAGDLAFIAGREPRTYDIEQWRTRITQTPFKEALSLVWYVNDVEGIFTRLVAPDSLCRAVLSGGAEANTDDRNRLEFAIARSVGRDAGFRVETLRAICREHRWQPRFVSNALDELTMLDRRSTEFAVQEIDINEYGGDLPPEVVMRSRAKDALAKGKLDIAGELWHQQAKAPADPYEIGLVALTYAAEGDARALPFIAQLRQWRPVDADLLEVHYLWHSRKFREALPAMEKMLKVLRTEPWVNNHLFSATLHLLQVTEFAPSRHDDVQRLYESVAQPFAVHRDENLRLQTWLHLARRLDLKSYSDNTRQVLESLEPHFLWDGEALKVRADCYRALHHPLAQRALVDLHRFQQNETMPFASFLPLPTTVSAREISGQ